MYGFIWDKGKEIKEGNVFVVSEYVSICVWGVGVENGKNLEVFMCRRLFFFWLGDYVICWGGGGRDFEGWD